MKKTLTSYEVAAVNLELRNQLQGARIQNIYQINEKTLILKLHQPRQPAFRLLIESGRRLHLTSYKLKKPQRPPAFCMALRKYLRNGFIAEFHQHEFERIVHFQVESKQGPFTLTVELFGNGNIILADSEGMIRHALIFKKMRDRNILRGEPFQQPPSSGRNPLNAKWSDILQLKGFRDLEVIKALSRFLSISGTYAEEILLRSQVDKNKSCKSLNERELDRIFISLNDVISPLKTGKLEPRIIFDEKKRWIDVVPTSLRRYESFESKEYDSFMQALDDFYAKTAVERKVTVAEERVEAKIARQQSILQKQRKSMEKAQIEAKQLRRVGDIIYSHFNQLQMLLHRIMNAKKKGQTWREIVHEITKEQKGGKPPQVYFKSLDIKNLILELLIDDLLFSLNLRNSVQENAATYYDRAKKNKRKVRGAKDAIEETLNRIEELKHKKAVVVEETSKPIKKKRKKAWYEKFRWFFTSENFLVIGGKDAVTNEILIKRHMAPSDLVFHADLVGAPFVLLKTDTQTPSHQSISEAAQLAASYSRAWRIKFSAIDVYWVHPDQVSKTPPTGEYLPRGAFMIRGKKNYLKGIPIRLAIGVSIRKTSPSVIGGPTEAIKNQTNIYVEISPGDFSSRKLADKIRQILQKKADKKLGEMIAKIPIEHIQTFIPYGKGRISND